VDHEWVEAKGWATKAEVAVTDSNNRADNLVDVVMVEYRGKRGSSELQWVQVLKEQNARCKTLMPDDDGEENTEDDVLRSHRSLIAQ
jgi:hypothetical protein